MAYQQTFGKSEIRKAQFRGICDCGNGAYLAIDTSKETNYYCKQCARDAWIQEVKE